MGMSTNIYPLPCEDEDETKVWYPLGWVWEWWWIFSMGISMG